MNFGDQTQSAHVYAGYPVQRLRDCGVLHEPIADSLTHNRVIKLLAVDESTGRDADLDK